MQPRDEPGSRTSNRLVAGALMASALGVLSIAVWIRPDPRGFGSHEQLGLPPCLPVMLWGVPCPTCGMCTAFAHTVRAQPLAALHAQPAGFVLACLTLWLAIASAVAVATGRPLPWRVLGRKAIFLLALAILLGWAYKVVVMLPR